ncbi:MAG: hypothetical protein ACD_75C02637G0001 [uncultured bacterium]|nr:MAG: hypothetical protein ACD_75C02637G0001 [uncultured bacterium]
MTQHAEKHWIGERRAEIIEFHTPSGTRQQISQFAKFRLCFCRGDTVPDQNHRPFRRGEVVGNGFGITVRARADYWQKVAGHHLGFNFCVEHLHRQCQKYRTLRFGRRHFDCPTQCTQQLASVCDPCGPLCEGIRDFAEIPTKKAIECLKIEISLAGED